MKGKAIKFLIGFGIFFAYYLVARNLENRFTQVQGLTKLGM
jgi:hypothetical protein